MWISIDPGMHMGYAVWDGEKLITSGSHCPKASPKDFNKILGREIRVGYIRKCVQALITDYNITKLAIEYPVISKIFQSNSVVIQVRIWSVILDQFLAHNIPWEEFSPTAIKYAATGSGAAAKPLVMERVAETFGEEHAKSPDQADAVAIGMCMINLQHKINNQPVAYPLEKYRKPEKEPKKSKPAKEPEPPSELKERKKKVKKTKRKENEE